MISFNNFTDAYYHLIQQVYEEYDYECAPRGMKIREILGAKFEILNPRNRLPYIPERNYSISYYVGEALWYLNANDSVKWIAKYSPFWNDVTDDGQIARASYGARIFNPHCDVDNAKQVQWKRIVDELTKDPDSRRAVIYFGQPGDHRRYNLDIGCTTSAQFFIRNGKLNQIVTMRSNDLILGTPYDISAFTLFQELLALQLEVELGTYVHCANSLHIYERNFPLAEMVLDGWNNTNLSSVPPCPPMPNSLGHVTFYKLNQFESEIWKRTNPEEVRGLLNNYISNQEEDYWNDWACILAAHRAKKLTDNKKVNRELRKEFFNMIKFEGYKRFRK